MKGYWKSVVKRGITISIGTCIGAVILPYFTYGRILQGYPPLWKLLLINFFASFGVILVIELIFFFFKKLFKGN